MSINSIVKYNNNPTSGIEFLYDGFVYILKIKNKKIIHWADQPGWGSYRLRIQNFNDDTSIDSSINEALFEETVSEETIDTILKTLPSRNYIIHQILNEGDFESSFVSNYAPLDNQVFGSGYYNGDGNGPLFLFTKSISEIDKARIAHYKNLIQQGARPRVITLEFDFPDDKGSHDCTLSFILDGHHKILAYQELNINPAFLHFETPFLFEERQNPKNEFLILELLDILEPDAIHKILFNHPRVHYDDSEEAIQFNRYFDAMLGHTTTFSSFINVFFEQEFQKGTPQSKAWLIDRLDAMLLSLEKNKNIKCSIAAFASISNYELCDITNFQEFDDWVKKVIGISYNELVGMT